MVPPWLAKGLGLDGAAERADRPLHVCHVTEAPLGGVVAHLDELIARQLEDGLRVDLVTPAINLDALSDVIPRLGAVSSFALERGGVRPLAVLGAQTLRRARASRPDLVHVHSTFAGAVVRGLRAGLPRGTGLVYCPHGWAFLRRGRAAARYAAAAVERGLARRSDRIVCVSEFEREEGLAAGLPPDRLVVVENGVSDVPAPAARRPEAGPLVVGFAGRFDRQKGYDTFLEAMRMVPEMRGITVGRPIVAGQAPPEAPPNVEHRGWLPREAVRAFYGEVDVLMVPSRWEGLCLVGIEAMQAGTPLLASRIGGLAELVEDGRTGRIFEPDDAEGAAALLRSASREGLRAMGEAGRRRYRERYTAERMARGMAAVYEDVLAARRR